MLENQQEEIVIEINSEEAQMVNDCELIDASAELEADIEENEAIAPADANEEEIEEEENEDA